VEGGHEGRGFEIPIRSDVAEQLEWVPATLKVIRHVRPEYACDGCSTLVQASAPSRPIARGLAGPGLLAHVLVSKYQDHLPLYRQSAIYARSGIDLDRSTLADWVGGATKLLEPLVDALGRYVRAAAKLHADDTPVPVLSPGRGSTRQGRLWIYVRDDRPAGSADPPAVWMQYTPDRKGEHPRRHLQPFTGVLQADAYAGFERLYGEKIQEAAWLRACAPLLLRGACGTRLAGRRRSARADRYAGVDVGPRDRSKLERLCRSFCGPPVAMERLALTPSGQVRYAVETPCR
jgi:transposase